MKDVQALIQSIKEFKYPFKEKSEGLIVLNSTLVMGKGICEEMTAEKTDLYNPFVSERIMERSRKKISDSLKKQN